MEIKGWLASKPKEAIVELWRRKLRQRPGTYGFA
jgi:hypothetical protein